MTYVGLWSLAFAFGEAVQGVAKSKDRSRLNFLFWAHLFAEFACAFALTTHLFNGTHGAFRVTFKNRGIRLWTSSLVFVIDGILLVVEAVYVALKLHESDAHLHNSLTSCAISVVLFPLLVVPTIPILITSFWTDVNTCLSVNRSVLDPLTMVVATTPVIGLVAGFIVWKFVSELHASKRVVASIAIFVAYVCYSGPVLALGILLMRTPSDCDKHTVLVVFNLIPAVVIWCSGLVLDVGRNPDSENPEVPDENSGAGLSDASARTPEQHDMSSVSDSINSR